MGFYAQTRGGDTMHVELHQHDSSGYYLVQAGLYLQRKLLLDDFTGTTFLFAGTT
jgi:hypothetical protein